VSCEARCEARRVVSPATESALPVMGPQQQHAMFRCGMSKDVKTSVSDNVGNVSPVEAKVPTIRRLEALLGVEGQYRSIPYRT